MGIDNTFASVPGMIAPSVTSALTPDVSSDTNDDYKILHIMPKVIQTVSLRLYQ